MKKINLEGQLSWLDDIPVDVNLRKDSPVTKDSTQSVPRHENSVAASEASIPHNRYEALFLRLAQSKFRSGFHLRPADIAYIEKKGMSVIRQHAADFVAKRLAPAVIPNDGKQTPMRGHPVFLAQHATACCCRGCFEKWHHIPAGRALTAQEQEYAVCVLMEWIEKEYNNKMNKNGL